MPRYIGYRPQFEPISLQEYLAVPTTILGEYAKAEDVYNETANKAEALKALLGERNADNEAGWKIVDRYENMVRDTANAVLNNGIQGPDAYRQAKNASTYYRQNMLPLESGIPAYQEELKKYNSDPTMIGTKPVLESYIKNPLYRAQMMSGSAIQNEAAKAAASASARRKQETADKLIRGGQYYSYRELTGFSPEEVAAWLQDHNNSPELSAIYNQIKDKYEQSGYTEDQFRQYIERGIIDGITYDSKRHDAENKLWALNHTASKSGKTGTSGEEKPNPYLQQSLASPDLGQKSQLSEETGKKLTSSKTFSNNGYDIYPTGQVKPSSNVANTYGLAIPKIVNYTNQRTSTSNEPYREMGIYEASAAFYGKQNDVQKQSQQTDAEARHTIASVVKKVDMRGNPTGSINDISQRNFRAINGLAVAAGFNKYKSFNDIPKDVKDRFYRYIQTPGANTGLTGYKVVDPNEEIAKTAFSRLLNTTTDNSNVPEGLLTKKEFDELKNKGVRFYNEDGTPRSNDDIKRDAWDLLPKQYERYELTHTRGAGAKYAQSATADYFAEFPSGKKYQTIEGKDITLKMDKDGTGFADYARPRYFLSAPLLRKGTGYKQLELTEADNGKKHTVEVPLSAFERGVINSELKRLRGNLVNRLATSGYLSDYQATQIASMPLDDFLKYIEMGYLPGVHINDILDLLDDAILTASEENYIPSNSETEGKLYD